MKLRRVLASHLAEAGRPVERAMSTSHAAAALSVDETETLSNELQSIREAQQAALATGKTHYLR